MQSSDQTKCVQLWENVLLGELNFSNKAHGGAAAWIEESLGLMHGLRFRAICN